MHACPCFEADARDLHVRWRTCRCSFELYVSLWLACGAARDGYTWCVYTKPSSGEAVGFTDGVAPVDARYGAVVGGHYKSNREAKFPLPLAEQALGIRLEHAQASVEADRIHILNCMAGAADLSAPPPPDDHPAFKAVNEALCARFAAAALRAAVDANGH